MFKKFLLLTVSVVLFLSLALPTFAQDANKLEGNSCLYKGTVTLDCVAPLVANLIYWLIILSGTVAVFFIIFGGIKLLTSGGAQDKVESAKKTITFAVIGLVVVILSFMTVNIVADLTGVNCITRFGFTSCGQGPTACKDSSPGYCINADEICVQETYPGGSGGRYICKGVCSKNYPSGYCPSPKECIRKDSEVYNCDNYCSNDYHNGWCPTGKCTRTSAVPEVWGCR